MKTCKRCGESKFSFQIYKGSYERVCEHTNVCKKCAKKIAAQAVYDFEHSPAFSNETIMDAKKRMEEYLNRKKELTYIPIDETSKSELWSHIQHITENHNNWKKLKRLLEEDEERVRKILDQFD